MRRFLPRFINIANLGISAKLGLIVGVLALPIAALMFVQYQQQNDAQAQAESEADGLEYVASVIPFLREVQVHRGLVQRYLNGDVNSGDNMKQTAAAADAALAALTAVDGKFGGDLGTESLVQFLNTEWPRVRDLRTSASESNDAHTTLIEEGIFELLSTVTIQSELALDPDIDSRSVILALTDSLPRLTEALSQMRSYGTAEIGRASCRERV